MGIAEPAKRATMPRIAKARRTKGFDEVEKGYSLVAGAPRRCAACSASARRTAASMISSAWASKHGMTSNSLVAPGAMRIRAPRTVRAPVHPPDMERCIS